MAEKFVEVRDVLDQWISPDHRYFKVAGEDGSVYILRHDSKSLEWELTFFCAPERLT